MKYFKLSASRASKRYKITPTEFSRVTQRKYPYEQINEQGKLVQYGICPSCLNPIQLIGVVKETSLVYGKHTGKNIPGFPNWNQRKYEYCPYAAKNARKVPNDDEWLHEIDEGVIELYRLLKKQFDRVVYVVSHELDIRCSTAFWSKVLKQYLINKIYLYPWLTEVNLPYVFAYFGMQHQNILGQQVRVNSEIYHALINHNDVQFSDERNGYVYIKNRKGHFLSFYFRFINHTHKVQDGEELTESMLFCIDDRTNGVTVYEKQITFSETYFMNTVGKKSNENKRNHQLLSIANELMTDEPITEDK